MRTSMSGKLPRDFREILSWWSTSRELADALGIPDSMVRQWKMRNSIPANFWAALCETAIAERNDLTTRKLALLIDFRNNPSDFIWGSRKDAWETMLDELKRYRDEHGDCHVPHGWGQNSQLARWVVTQRTRWGSLSSVRRARLEELGFQRRVGPAYPWESD
jgi:hypothetical protein